MQTLLLVDDDAGFCSAARDLLEALDYSVTTADSVATAKKILKTQKFDRVFLDLMLPDGSGLHVLDAIPKSDLSDVQITIVTGHPALKGMVRTVDWSEVNYLIKPIDLEKLKRVLETTPQSEASPKPPKPEKNAIKKHFGYLIGESEAMQQLYTAVERVARTDVNVMLIGESGVGKELVAMAIHDYSAPSGPFIAANCGAFARELINSELFGHEKGAFTGAITGKAGVFEQAHTGTLFLDEITEMPLDLQPNLLRVLQNGNLVRLGSTKPIDINCRVISATNRSETEMAEDNCLREDLYFRLAVFPIYVPPLRSRPEDISLLANYFLLELNEEHDTDFQLTDDTIERLENYTWPGNVRELRHTIHRAFIMSDPNQSLLMLPRTLSSPFSRRRVDSSLGSIQVAAGQSLEAVEKELIQLTLDALNGDKREAAKVLGVSVKTVYNRLKEYEDSDQKNKNGSGASIVPVEINCSSD